MNIHSSELSVWKSLRQHAMMFNGTERFAGANVGLQPAVAKRRLKESQFPEMKNTLEEMAKDK